MKGCVWESKALMDGAGGEEEEGEGEKRRGGGEEEEKEEKRRGGKKRRGGGEEQGEGEKGLNSTWSFIITPSLPDRASLCTSSFVPTPAVLGGWEFWSHPTPSKGVTFQASLHILAALPRPLLLLQTRKPGFGEINNSPR